MKIIKNLSAKSRIYMYQAINSSSDKGITMAERNARKSIFKKIGEGVDIFPSGGIKVENDFIKDVILKQSELDVLKKCLEQAVWPTMLTSLEAEKAEEAANEAEDYKEEAANLTPETAEEVDQVIKG